MKQLLVITDGRGLALTPDLLLLLQDKLGEDYEVLTVDKDSQHLQTYLADFNQPILMLKEGLKEERQERIENLLQQISSLPVQDFQFLSKDPHSAKIRQQDRWPGQSYRSRRGKYR